MIRRTVESVVDRDQPARPSSLFSRQSRGHHLREHLTGGALAEDRVGARSGVPRDVFVGRIARIHAQEPFEPLRFERSHDGGSFYTAVFVVVQVFVDERDVRVDGKNRLPQTR